MQEQQLEGFLAALQSDEGLQERLRSAASPEAVVAIANDAGFEIAISDIQKSATLVSEDELENLSGGAHPFCSNATNVPGVC